MLVSACVQSWTAANNWSASSHLNYPEKTSDAVQPLGKNGWVSWYQENSYYSSSEWLEKTSRTSSHLLSWLQWRMTYHTTLEVIGSKQSYALKWCKLHMTNNDDDDDIACVIFHTYFTSTMNLYGTLAQKFLMHRRIKVSWYLSLRKIVVCVDLSFSVWILSCLWTHFKSIAWGNFDIVALVKHRWSMLL